MTAAGAQGYVFHTISEAATERLGEALGGIVRPDDVLLLSGDLGAGKTRLTKGIARGLGVTEPVTSPTFNLVLVHEGRLSLYHVDLYRVDTAAELEGIGYFDALEAGGVAVVEWGDRFAEAGTPDAVEVRLEIEGDELRKIMATAASERGRALIADWADAAQAADGVAVGETP